MGCHLIPTQGDLALGSAYLLRPGSEVYNIAELSEESCEAQALQDRVVTYQLLQTEGQMKRRKRRVASLRQE
jgi:hypothetical protein